MLRLDADMVQEQHMLSKEQAITEELISLGALTSEQLETVHQARRQVEAEQERRWGRLTEKSGASGDVISSMLAPQV